MPLHFLFVDSVNSFSFPWSWIMPCMSSLLILLISILLLSLLLLLLIVLAHDTHLLRIIIFAIGCVLVDSCVVIERLMTLRHSHLSIVHPLIWVMQVLCLISWVSSRIVWSFSWVAAYLRLNDFYLTSTLVNLTLGRTSDVLRALLVTRYDLLLLLIIHELYLFICQLNASLFRLNEIDSSRVIISLDVLLLHLLVRSSLIIPLLLLLIHIIIISVILGLIVTLLS